MVICCCKTIAETSSDFKELVPLISPLVVIILFIVDRFIAHYLRGKEAERNWYLKVLIEPNIEKISDFYKQVIEQYSESISVLYESTNIPHAEYNSLKAKEFGKFQTKKRELELDVVFPIQIQYPSLGNDLTQILLDLEDKYTNALDKEPISKDGAKEYHHDIASNKATLLQLLYKPLTQKYSRTK